MSMRPWFFLFFCLLMLGCDVVEQPATPPTEQPPRVSASTLPTFTAPQPTAAPPATAPPSAAPPAALGDGWQQVEWHHILIGLPPTATWQEQMATSFVFSDTAVIAQGALTYPAVDGGVEGLYGPTFVLLRFSGSLDDWLVAERQRDLPGNPVDENTIARRELAGTQALVYQRAITGVGAIAYYALKVTPDQILWISSENTENQTYNAVLNHVSILP